MAGYKAISDFSKADNGLVRRNADVLVQLLQSEDEFELESIKRALNTHIDIDAFATFQVMLDCCLPHSSDLNAAESMNVAPLTAVVVSFLLNEAKGSLLASVRRKEKGIPLEELSFGLIKIVQHSSQTQGDAIVRQLLLSIQGALSDSRHAESLLHSVQPRVEEAWRKDMETTPSQRSLDITLQRLQLCRDIIHASTSIDTSGLLQFCVSCLIVNCPKYTKVAKAKALSLTLDILQCRKDTAGEDLSRFTNPLVFAGSYLLPDLQMPPPDWKSIQSYLNWVSKHLESNKLSTPPKLIPPLMKVRENVRSASQLAPTVKNRIENTLEMLLPSSSKTSSDQSGGEALSFRNAAQNTPDAPEKKRKRLNDQQSVQSSNSSDSYITFKSLASSRTMSQQSDDGVESLFKRSRTNTPNQSRDNLPSLLRRMQVASPPRTPVNESGPNAPDVGFSIKGAASSPPIPISVTPRSLQERLSDLTGTEPARQQSSRRTMA